MAIVYMATNRVNQKRYIGLTSLSMHTRRKGHFKQARNGRRARFAAAIRKYGEDAFDWCELCSTDTVAEAKEKEIELIALLKPEYNVTSGGDGTHGVAAHNRQAVMCLSDGMVFESGASAESHYSLGVGYVSVSCSGLYITRGLHFIKYKSPLSEEDRKSLIADRLAIRVKRRRQRQQPHNPIGRPQLRIKDALGRSMAGPMTNARAVYCLDDGQTYDSASSAAVAYDVPKSGVIELCLGKRGRKTVGGHRFAYVTSQ